jgi:hypothetical protein
MRLALSFIRFTSAIMLASVLPLHGSGAAEPELPGAEVRLKEDSARTELDANKSDAEAEKNSASAEPSTDTTCGPLQRAAATYGIPADFFSRLIRQESNFDPNSVSRAGALGIAQFMPATAHWRGLSDPFAPVEALNESARWLRELADQFGNLGLAAAAYNAGPRRVKDWISGRGRLPSETRAYVRIITGRSADEWIGASLQLQNFASVAGSCAELARQSPAAKADRRELRANPDMSWGLQLIGDASETKALDEYAQLRRRYRAVLGDHAPTVVKKPLGGRGPSAWYFVRVAEASREKAVQLCSKLKSAGGSCLVLRN